MELLTQMVEFTCNGSSYGQEAKDEKVEEVKVCHKFDADIEALGVFYGLEPGSEVEGPATGPPTNLSENSPP